MFDDINKSDAQQCAIRRGRPKKSESYRNIHSVRFDDDEEAMLRHLEVESDDNKSDIIRKALRKYYKMESAKW